MGDEVNFKFYANEDNEVTEIECQVCEGSGMIRDSILLRYTPCPDCKGTGEKGEACQQGKNG